jgi:hypothetical protein
MPASLAISVAHADEPGIARDTPSQTGKPPRRCALSRLWSECASYGPRRQSQPRPDSSLKLHPHMRFRQPLKSWQARIPRRKPPVFRPP